MAITHEIRVPNIGDFKNVPIVELLVKVGDVVRVEDPLVAIESEKATMEVPSPFAGTIGRIDVKLGDNVSEGSVLLQLTTEGEAPVVAPTVAAEKPAEAAAPAPPATPAPPSPQAPAALPATPDAPASNGVVHASPSIRRFARELGVDLHRVSGSGPHARITRDDVQNFVKVALAAPPGATTTSTGTPYGVPAWPVVDFAKYGEIEVVKLSRIRKFSGPNLHRNWLAIPHVTNNDEADITELEAFRKAVNKERPDAKVTMLAFVMKAVVVALRAHPEVNSSLDGDSLVLKKYYNIGFAADTPQGLVVPVLAGADAKGVLAIATETSALAAKARDGKLAMAEMTGATFTISSLGGIGGTSFTPIVNAPEVAILGVSRSSMTPVWDGAAFVPRLMLPLSLSYDHRVIDGAQGARFIAFLGSVLSDIRRLVL